MKEKIDDIREKIAMYIIWIGFRIMPLECLEDVYATLLHWNLQRNREDI